MPLFESIQHEIGRLRSGSKPNMTMTERGGPDGIGLNLADIVSLGGASPFGYSARIKPLATLRPFRYSVSVQINSWRILLERIFALADSRPD